MRCRTRVAPRGCSFLLGAAGCHRLEKIRVESVAGGYRVTALGRMPTSGGEGCSGQVPRMDEVVWFDPPHPSPIEIVVVQPEGIASEQVPVGVRP